VLNITLELVLSSLKVLSISPKLCQEWCCPWNGVHKVAKTHYWFDQIKSTTTT